MVKGLELFRSRFMRFSDNYILIGGATCDILLERVAVPFRVTRDLDIVLCVESLSPEFGRVFWKFIKDGAYQLQEKPSGDKKLYRFSNPLSPGYPEMLELFSRQPDALKSVPGAQLTPIPIKGEVSSLSAILLDDEYYDLIHANRIQVDGLSLLSSEALIVLKAKAWLDLSERKARGEHVDSKNIKKHKNDICRLFAAISGTAQLNLSAKVQSEMRFFLEQMQKEQVDLKAMGLPLTIPEVMDGLHSLFNI